MRILVSGTNNAYIEESIYFISKRCRIECEKTTSDKIEGQKSDIILYLDKQESCTSANNTLYFTSTKINIEEVLVELYQNIETWLCKLKLVKKKEVIDNELLIKFYVKQELGLEDLKRIFGIGRKKLDTWFKKCQIEKRSPPNKKIEDIHIILSKDFLIEEYVNKLKTILEISKEVGIGTRRIREQMIKYGIQGREWFKSENRVRHYKKNWKCGVSAHYWYEIEARVKNKGYEFSIGPDYIWQLFLQQNSKCALSDADIRLKEAGEPSKNQTASLDRIDSSKGYVEGNVQWVHKDVNKMKWDFPEDTFIQWCRLIAKKADK